MADSPQKPVVSAEERQRLIRRAAYQHCLRRGGTEGQDIHDRLAAEAEVNAMLGPARESDARARGTT